MNLRQTYPVQLNGKALVPCLVINWSPVCLANHFIVHFEHSKDLIWTKEETWIIKFHLSCWRWTSQPISRRVLGGPGIMQFIFSLSFAEIWFLLTTLVPGWASEKPPCSDMPQQVHREPCTHYLALHSGIFLQHHGHGCPGQLVSGKGTSNHLGCHRWEKNLSFGNVLEHFPTDPDTPSVSLPAFLRNFRRIRNIIIEKVKWFQSAWPQRGPRISQIHDFLLNSLNWANL